MKAVIIQTAFIGDVILCTPLIETLHLNDWEVGFVAKPEAAEVLRADERISRLHVYDKKGDDSGINGLRRMIKELRNENYDFAVVPHRSVRSAVLTKFSNIPKTAGFSTSSGSRLFDHKIEYKKNVHEIIRNHELLKPLGIHSGPPAPNVKVSSENVERAEKQFSEWGISGTDTVIALGPGSKWYTKRWGVERYRSLAELILRESTFKVICFGGPEEREICEHISTAGPERIFNAAGIFSLLESSAALRKTSLAVSNDNGLMNLAVASGTKVIAIFGPTSPSFGFYPWGDGNQVVERELYCRPCSIHGTVKCPEKHFRCMAEILPEEMFEIIEQNIE